MSAERDKFNISKSVNMVTISKALLSSSVLLSPALDIGNSTAVKDRKKGFIRKVSAEE